MVVQLVDGSTPRFVLISSVGSLANASIWEDFVEIVVWLRLFASILSVCGRGGNLSSKRTWLKWSNSSLKSVSIKHSPSITAATSDGGARTARRRPRSCWTIGSAAADEICAGNQKNLLPVTVERAARAATCGRSVAHGDKELGVPPPVTGGVVFYSSANLATKHTIYELCLPFERGTGYGHIVWQSQVSS